MPEQRIKELELELVTANASIATLTATNLELVTANASISTLTASNVELARGLSAAEFRNKKLRRGARKDVSSLKAQLLTAQSRRN